MTNCPKNKDFDCRLNKLCSLIIDLQVEPSLLELESMLEEGVSPNTLLSCYIDGMHEIGLRFGRGEYYISALVMADEIMRNATEILTPYLPIDKKKGRSFKFLLGTIQGDIHELGKNIFSLLLKCQNHEVIDIGVDIPPQVFLYKAEKNKPDIVGISSIMTFNIENLKKTVNLLTERQTDPKAEIIIGGTYLDESIARYVGSRYWTRDSYEGLQICQRILKRK